MTGPLEFFIVINLVGVFACILCALTLLGLMINDQLYRQRKHREHKHGGYRPNSGRPRGIPNGAGSAEQ
jgi:hypothetical protein